MSSLPIELTAGGAAAAELLRRAGAPEPGCRDELRDGDARLRTPWKHFAQWLPAEGLAADLERRGAALAAQIRADGVTYNVYGAEGAHRPWSLDLLPLMVSRPTGRRSRAGVAAARELLDACWPTSTAPQRLLARRPAAAGAAVRPPRLPAAAAGRDARRAALHLHIVAFDLARAPDGQLVGGGAAHAGAVGPGLRAGEPADHLAPVPRSVPRAARAAPRGELPARCSNGRVAAAPVRRRRARRASCC